MSAASATARRRWLTRPGLRIGVVATLLFVLLGFVSIVWTPYPVGSLDVGAAMQDFSAAHWFGTDQLGRDMFSLVMKGTLTSFVVAAIAAALGALVGIPLGLAAAAWGGVADWAVLRVSDFLLVFPALVVAIIITAVYGPSMANVMVAMGLFNIPAFARATRKGWLALAAADHVGAGRLAGTGTIEVAQRHILPSLGMLLLVQAMAQLAAGVMAEATLSYVGLGAQPPATSLGLMLREAQSSLMAKPALALIPGLMVVLIVIALHLIVDGLRERLDPRLRRSGGDHDAA